MIDFTKLQKKLSPEPQIGGDPGLRLRTATVSSIAVDGTVTLLMSGGSVPSVPVLAGATVGAGQVVQVLSYRGSLLVLGGTGNKMLIRKSSDQNLTLNSTSMQNVTDLGFTAAAGAIYQIDLWLTYTGNSAQDIQAAWTVPSGANMIRHIIAPTSGASDYQNTAVSMVRRSAATGQVAGAPGTTNGFVLWREESLLAVSSTGGAVQLQAAQAAAGSASPNTSVRGDSMIIVERVG